jgi:hypothetical protein
VNIRLRTVLALGSLAALCVVGARPAGAQLSLSSGINTGLLAWDNATLTAAVQTLQGQVGTLQSQLANANSQIAYLQSYTQYVEDNATCTGIGESQGFATYQNFLDNPGYYKNVGLKYCHKP